MRRRALPSPAMVVALMALFVALGGTGYAASGALSDDSSPQATVARRGRRASNRGPRGFRGFRGATGATGPAGPAGAQGTQGTQGPAGPAGTAKAFAQVTSRGRVVPGHALNISDANISVIGPGRYCFDLSAIGITTTNAVAIATPDYNDADTASGTIVHVTLGNSFGNCPAGTIGVRAYNDEGTLRDAGFSLAFL
jgi:Collagen triple helix repeat (20 copies)